MSRSSRQLPAPPNGVPPDLEERRQAMLFRTRNVNTNFNSLGGGSVNGGVGYEGGTTFTMNDGMLSVNSSNMMSPTIVMSSLPIAQSTHVLFSDGNNDDGNDNGTDPAKLLALLKRKKKEKERQQQQQKAAAVSSSGSVRSINSNSRVAGTTRAGGAEAYTLTVSGSNTSKDESSPPPSKKLQKASVMGAQMAQPFSSTSTTSSGLKRGGSHPAVIPLSTTELSTSANSAVVSGAQNAQKTSLSMNYGGVGEDDFDIDEKDTVTISDALTPTSTPMKHRMNNNNNNSSNNYNNNALISGSGSGSGSGTKKPSSVSGSGGPVLLTRSEGPTTNSSSTNISNNNETVVRTALFAKKSVSAGASANLSGSNDGGSSSNSKITRSGSVGTSGSANNVIPVRGIIFPSTKTTMKTASPVGGRGGGAETSGPKKSDSATGGSAASGKLFTDKSGSTTSNSTASSTNNKPKVDKESATATNKPRSSGNVSEINDKNTNTNTSGANKNKNITDNNNNNNNNNNNSFENESIIGDIIHKIDESASARVSVVSSNSGKGNGSSIISREYEEEIASDDDDGCDFEEKAQIVSFNPLNPADLDANNKNKNNLNVTTTNVAIAKGEAVAASVVSTSSPTNTTNNNNSLLVDNVSRFLPPSRVGVHALPRPMTPNTVRPHTQQRQVQSAMAWATATSAASVSPATNVPSVSPIPQSAGGGVGPKTKNDDNQTDKNEKRNVLGNLNEKNLGDEPGSGASVATTTFAAVSTDVAPDEVSSLVSVISSTALSNLTTTAVAQPNGNGNDSVASNGVPLSTRPSSPPAIAPTSSGPTVVGVGSLNNCGRPVTRQKHPRMALDLFGNAPTTSGAIHSSGLGGGGNSVSRPVAAAAATAVVASGAMANTRYTEWQQQDQDNNSPLATLSIGAHNLANSNNRPSIQAQLLSQQSGLGDDDTYVFATESPAGGDGVGLFLASGSTGVDGLSISPTPRHLSSSRSKTSLQLPTNTLGLNPAGSLTTTPLTSNTTAQNPNNSAVQSGMVSGNSKKGPSPPTTITTFVPPNNNNFLSGNESGGGGPVSTNTCATSTTPVVVPSLVSSMSNSPFSRDSPFNAGGAPIGGSITPLGNANTNAAAASASSASNSENKHAKGEGRSIIKQATKQQQQQPSGVATSNNDNVDFSCLFFKSENELDDELMMFPTKAQAQLVREREKLEAGAPSGGGLFGASGGGVSQPLVIESSSTWFTADAEDPELVKNIALFSGTTVPSIKTPTAKIASTTNAASSTTSISTTTTNPLSGGKRERPTAAVPNLSFLLSPAPQTDLLVNINNNTASSSGSGGDDLEAIAAALNSATAQWDSLPITDGKPRFHNRRSSTGGIDREKQQTPANMAASSLSAFKHPSVSGSGAKINASSHAVASSVPSLSVSVLTGTSNTGIASGVGGGLNSLLPTPRRKLHPSTSGGITFPASVTVNVGGGGILPFTTRGMSGRTVLFGSSPSNISNTCTHNNNNNNNNGASSLGGGSGSLTPNCASGGTAGHGVVNAIHLEITNSRRASVTNNNSNANNTNSSGHAGNGLQHGNVGGGTRGAPHPPPLMANSSGTNPLTGKGNSASLSISGGLRSQRNSGSVNSSNSNNGNNNNNSSRLMATAASTANTDQNDVAVATTQSSTGSISGISVRGKATQVKGSPQRSLRTAFGGAATEALLDVSDDEDDEEILFIDEGSGDEKGGSVCPSAKSKSSQKNEESELYEMLVRLRQQKSSKNGVSGK